MKQYRIIYNGESYRVQWKGKWRWRKCGHWVSPEDYVWINFSSLQDAETYIFKEIRKESKKELVKQHGWQVVKEIP